MFRLGDVSLVVGLGLADVQTGRTCCTGVGLGLAGVQTGRTCCTGVGLGLVGRPSQTEGSKLRTKSGGRPAACSELNQLILCFQ